MGGNRTTRPVSSAHRASLTRVIVPHAEYALRDSARPLGVSEYQLAESLPEPLQTSLPTIEQIERELAGGQE